MKARYVLSTLASALAVAALITACGGTPSATATDTTQLQSEITALQQQVAALQTAVAALGASPAVFIKAPNAPTAQTAHQQRGDKAQGPAAACTGLGTLTGRPDNSDPLITNNISGVSCQGYYFTVSGAATAADTATVQPLDASVAVWFDAPNCTGNAYVTVAPGGISQAALANGAVFTVGDPTVASNYLMLKPGTTSSEPNLQSRLQGGACDNVAISQLIVYALAPNDPTVSGVPSAPIPGPVTIG